MPALLTVVVASRPGIDALLVRAHADKVRAADPKIADPTKTQQELRHDAENPEKNPMAGKTNHYTVLGLNYDFTPSDLKKAYKRGSKMHHPDRKSGSASAFQRVAFAHKTLEDEVARAKYDNGGDIEKGFDRNARDAAHWSWPEPARLLNALGDNGGMHRQHPPRGVSSHWCNPSA